jgi:hypothetical protein
MRILAIDPGSTQSAWLVLDDGFPLRHGIDPNPTLLARLRYPDPEVLGAVDVVVVEWMTPRGMPTSAEEFETLYWIGRFAEAVEVQGHDVERLPRRTVKLELCGSTKAKDANVRQVLLDRFGGSTAKGTKAVPGPLYGVSRDVWAALAVAVAYHDLQVAA